MLSDDTFLSMMSIRTRAQKRRLPALLTSAHVIGCRQHESVTRSAPWQI